MSVGPVQLLMLSVDGSEPHPKIRAEVDRLRDNDAVRLIDLLVLRKDANGTVQVDQQSDLTTDEATEVGALIGALVGIGATQGEDDETALAFAEAGAEAGADGHLLDEDDVWYVADAIPNDTTVAVALIEHLWAIPLRDALRGEGAQLITDAWIHAADLVGIGYLAAEAAAAH
jgi:uncharacterized membrane protein